MNGALQGIMVLDLTSYIAGPFATMLLGDLGADILKIEQPGQGDMFRAADKDPALYSALFRGFNRNKKSATLNLASPQGKKIFWSLVEKSDVIVENFRPGVVDRLGIGYEAAAKLNPRIVYCSISAFGQHGPYSSKPGYDTIGQSLSGLLSLLTDVTNPQGPGAPFSDHLGGLYGCYGILAALYARARTGKGQKVETSLLEATMSFIGYSVTQYLDTGAVEVPNMVSRLHQAQIYAFVARDGLPFVVHLSHPKKFWEGLTHAIGRTDLRDDPRFKEGHAREKNYDQLQEILKVVMGTNTRDHWIEALEKHDVPCAPIKRIDEVLQDPQVRFLDRLVRTEDPELGTLHFVRNGVTLSGTPTISPARSPKLGEHNKEILGALGYSEKDIEGFGARGVI
jgi:crotonobetainyl-CoA:carnitine CoA-transferase CaiB-like acyl-CoA transferase